MKEGSLKTMLAAKIGENKYINSIENSRKALETVGGLHVGYFVTYGLGTKKLLWRVEAIPTENDAIVTLRNLSENRKQSMTYEAFLMNFERIVPEKEVEGILIETIKKKFKIPSEPSTTPPTVCGIQISEFSNFTLCSYGTKFESLMGFKEENEECPRGRNICLYKSGEFADPDVYVNTQTWETGSKAGDDLDRFAIRVPAANLQSYLKDLRSVALKYTAIKTN